MPSRFLNNININDEYSLPNADGSADQIITTDGAGQLSFVDQSTVVSGTSRTVSILVKNISSANGGVNLSKGDPVYIYGSVGASERLYVDLADAGDSSKMPCVALLDQNLSPNGEGTATVTGKLKNLITSPIDGATPTENDTIYVKSGGGLTLTKPTGSTNLIQNVGQVGRVSTSSDGNIVVSAILRSNDVPNLPTGKIWVGDGNTTVSDVVYLDETNERMGINTTSPSQTLQVNGGVLSTLGLYSDFALASNRNWSIETNTFGTGNWGGIAIKTSTSNGLDPNTTRFGIDSTGNVGIGTTSPDSLLEIASDSVTDFLKLTSTGGGSTPIKLIFEKSTSEQGIIEYNRNGDLEIYNTDVDGGVMIDGSASGGADLYVANTGSVGIGTTSPQEKLDISAGSIRLDDNQSITWASVDANVGRVRITGNEVNDYLTFVTDNSEKMRLTNTGLGIGTTNPSEKLEVIGKGIIRRTGSATAHSDTDLLVTDSTATGSTAQIELLGGNNGFSNIKFADTDSYTVGSIDYNHSSNSMSFRTNSSQNVVINSAGNVGIGLTTPQTGLQLYNTTDDTTPGGTYKSAIRLTSTYANTFGGGGELQFGLHPSTAGSDTLSVIKGSYSTFSSGNYGGDLEFHTRDADGLGLKQRMTIAHDGNVGIGTTSPDVSLEVVTASPTNGIIADFVNSTDAGGTTAAIKLSNTDSEACDVVLGANRVGANFGSDFFISLSDSVDGSNQERFRITEDGNVGIGTTSPSQKLHVSGNAIVSGIGVGTTTIYSNSVNLNNSGTLRIGNAEFLAKAGNDLSIYQGKIRIQQGGNVGIGTTSPDSRLEVNGEIDANGGDGYKIDGRPWANWGSDLLTLGDWDGEGYATRIMGSNSSEVMRVTGTNVGIGTISPAKKLTIGGIGIGNTDGLKIEDPSNTAYGAHYSYDDGSTTVEIGGVVNNALRDCISIARDATRTITIDTSERVGIGTTTPAAKLHVFGTTSSMPSLGAAPSAAQLGGSTYGTLFSTLTSGRGVIQQGRSDGTATSYDLLLQPVGGNVGIGTSSARTKLHVSGLTGDDDPALGSSTAPFFVSNTSTSYGLNIGVNNVGASWLQSQSNTSATAYEMSLNPLGGNVGVGQINPSEKLEVNGSVKATASTDAYKGYIKQSVICVATEKQDGTDYFFIPYNTSATSASAQYYNRMVAAYDGRVKKVYIKNTSGTPSADTVNLKKHVNNTTYATEYSATIANAASAGMSAVYNFANNDFTFNEGDNFGVLYQTVNSIGSGRSMAGVTVNIIVEYNIT